MKLGCRVHAVLQRKSWPRQCKLWAVCCFSFCQFSVFDVSVVWHSGSALVSISKVNLRRARLVLGSVTVSGIFSRCRTFISVCNQPPRSTQLGHPFVGRRNEYQPKGGDTLWLGSNLTLRQVWFVCGWQLKLCIPIVTHIWALWDGA